jgi:uncharacterized damage-inducible protein DinB
MQYLEDLFGYNAKFSIEITKSLRTIDHDKFINENVSAWGSLRNLTMHIIEVEDYWINKIIQNKPFEQYDFDNYIQIDVIEAKWIEMDREIDLFVSSLAPETLQREIKVEWDKEYVFPLEKVLQHLYTHTVHTRGQIVAAIRTLGGKVPFVDII